MEKRQHAPPIYKNRNTALSSSKDKGFLPAFSFHFFLAAPTRLSRSRSSFASHSLRRYAEVSSSGVLLSFRQYLDTSEATRACTPRCTTTVAFFVTSSQSESGFAQQIK